VWYRWLLPRSRGVAVRVGSVVNVSDHASSGAR
jgi:hypothetical protein